MDLARIYDETERARPLSRAKPSVGGGKEQLGELRRKRSSKETNGLA